MSFDETDDYRAVERRDQSCFSLWPFLYLIILGPVRTSRDSTYFDYQLLTCVKDEPMTFFVPIPFTIPLKRLTEPPILVADTIGIVRQSFFHKLELTKIIVGKDGFKLPGIQNHPGSEGGLDLFFPTCRRFFADRPKKRFKCGKHSRFSPGRRKKKHIDQESENDRTFIWWMSSSSATVTSLVIHQIHIFLFRTRTTLTPTRTSLKNT